MQNVINWCSVNWYWIAGAAAVLVSILNAATRHWSQHQGVARVLLFISEVLSILVSANVTNGRAGKLKLPLSSVPPNHRDSPTGSAAVDALVGMAAGVGLALLVVAYAAGCAGTWRDNATKVLSGGHQSGLAGFSMARDKYDTECLALAKQCTQPADKCAPLLECQAKRHKVFEGLKAWFHGLAAFGEVVPLISDGGGK